MAVTTARSLRRGLVPAEPMPRVEALAQLYREYGQVLRAGQIAMIAGRRGSQKSGFAMWLVRQWNLPTMYCNGDMAQWTADSRHISLCTGLHKDAVEDALLSPDPAQREAAIAATELSNLAFMHGPGPSLDEIDDEINAWVEAYDAYPRVIVVDNLLDVEAIAEDTHKNQIELLKEFKKLARTTNALVIVLHHNKDDGNPGYPADVKALQGRVSQTPEVILSVALENQPQPTMPFRMSVVKQRAGPQSPDATRWVELVATPDHTSFAGQSIYPQGVQSWQ